MIFILQIWCQFRPGTIGDSANSAETLHAVTACGKSRAYDFSEPLRGKSSTIRPASIFTTRPAVAMVVALCATMIRVSGNCFTASLIRLSRGVSRWLVAQCPLHRVSQPERALRI